MENELRPFWQKYFAFNWKFGLFLILIVCIPRFLLVLHANATANYRYIGLIMFLSALAPYLFLNKFGRRKIGIIKSKKYGWLGYGIITGLVFSILLYFVGEVLYGIEGGWISYPRVSPRLTMWHSSITLIRETTAAPYPLSI